MLKILILVLVLVFSPPTVMAKGKDLRLLFEEVKNAVVVLETMGHGYSETKPGELVSERSIGSGVVISEYGHVLTAAHVVQVAEVVNVRFPDGKLYYSTVLSVDMMADLALAVQGIEISQDPAQIQKIRKTIFESEVKPSLKLKVLRGGKIITLSSSGK